MTVETLINALVRQTTILIAQLATSRGVRAPLAQVADQVFMDLVRELERQGVSRRVSADMFGLGLRTYRRKIQRLCESSTDRGRSLWEVALEFIKASGLVSRLDVLVRFSSDDEAQVKAVLHDLSESQLIFSVGTGLRTFYRAASDEELETLQNTRGSEGEEELLIALLYREQPLTLVEIAALAQSEPGPIESCLRRLVAAGRVEALPEDGGVRYRAQALMIPLGSTVGWEAAVFDHFKALVTTVLGRLRAGGTAHADEQVGGSTFTIDVWPGHPLQDEVLGSLAQFRASLSQLRSKVAEHNSKHEVPECHTRAVIYVGQCLIHEGPDADE